MTEPNRHGFLETRWTLLGKAQHDATARNELMNLYYKPVRSFFISVARGRTDLAEDWTQQFFEKEWEYKDDHAQGRETPRGVINRADRELGTFRAYLSIALRRFALTRLIKPDTPFRGAIPVPLPDEPEAWDRLEIPQADSIEEVLRKAVAAFSEEWVLSRMSEALQRAAATCQKRGKEQHVTFFREHYLPKPGIEGSWEAIARRYSVPDVQLDGKTVRNRAATAERYFRYELRAIVREEVENKNASSAMRELLSILGERDD